jgi:two-component system, chemotaxis family, sensor kinase CheA
MAVVSGAQIRDLFAQEAEGRLSALGGLLLQLEQQGTDPSVVDSIFRELHTIKGSAAVAGLPDVSSLAHQLEDLVSDLRAGRTEATPELIDTLLSGLDGLVSVIERSLGEPELDGVVRARAPDPPATGDHAAARRPGAPASAPPHVPTATPVVRVPPSPPGVPASPDVTASVPPVPAGPEAASAPAATPAAAATSRSAAIVMVPLERLEELSRLVSESASAHLRVGRMLSDRFGTDPGLLAEFNELSRALNDLQDRAMRTQMVPVSTITDALHRTVRDLARSQGKDIRWDARGTDTELDRGVLHQLSDSLLHLVRNAVDHGIETPDERLAAGKPAQATIRLHAMQLGSEVIIAVTDDGRGVDLQRVRQEAGRHGVDTDGLSDDEVVGLTLRSGLSTASFVTDVSGRGVGLDVVRSNVEAARGRIEVRSRPGVGAEFRIIVPITLAVLRCLLVEAGGARYALPFHRVVRSQADSAAVRTHAEGRAVVWVDRRAVATSVLSEALGGGPAAVPDGPIVVLADSVQRHAFKVDRLLGQRDVVLKGLSRLLPKVPAVAGASVEPDGSVLLVLDPPGLIARAQRSGHVQAVAPPHRAVDGPQPRILVVDDALTVRELQRSILERAHFEVRVASDGVQAMALLAEEPADLVLTDVEMPNLDGFALTEAIRGNAALANTPVLILSSRASDADRQRGLDVGADGYIVKSGFDEASLLSAVDRLLGSRR